MRLIRLKEVISKTGLSRSSIYSHISEGKFPQNVPLGDRSVGWVESEIDAWLKQTRKELYIVSATASQSELINHVFC